MQPSPPKKRQRVDTCPWTLRAKLCHTDVKGCVFFQTIDPHILTRIADYLCHEDVVVFGMTCTGCRSRVQHLHEYWKRQLHDLGGVLSTRAHTKFNTPYKELFLRKHATTSWCKCGRNLIQTTSHTTCKMCLSAPLLRTVTATNLFSFVTDPTERFKNILKLLVRQVFHVTYGPQNMLPQFHLERFRYLRRDKLMETVLKLLGFYRRRQNAYHEAWVLQMAAKAVFSFGAPITFSHSRITIGDGFTFTYASDHHRRNLHMNLCRTFAEHLGVDMFPTCGTIFWDIEDFTLYLLAMCIFPVMTLPRILSYALDNGLTIDCPVGIWSHTLAHILHNKKETSAQKRIGSFISDMQIIHSRRTEKKSHHVWSQSWIRAWQKSARDQLYQTHPSALDVYVQAFFPKQHTTTRTEFPLPPIEQYDLDTLYENINETVRLYTQKVEKEIYDACGHILQVCARLASTPRPLPHYATADWFAEIVRTKTPLHLHRLVQVYEKTIPYDCHTYFYSSELGKTETMEKLFPM